MNLKEVKRLENKGLLVTFNNEESKLIAIKTLRDKCPCAECRELRGEGSHSEPIKISNKKKKVFNIVEHSKEESLSLDEIWSVGNYAIGMRWGDNHNSGIYTYDYLYSLTKTLDEDKNTNTNLNSNTLNSNTENPKS